MAFGIPNAQQLVAELTTPANLGKLQAAGLQMLEQFAKSNVIHLDISTDDSGPHFQISFTPKGNQP